MYAVRNSKVSTTDGPFAETKAQLGGFFLINARDLNEAIQVASRLPGARLGCIEGPAYLGVELNPFSTGRTGPLSILRSAKRLSTRENASTTNNGDEAMKTITQHKHRESAILDDSRAKEVKMRKVQTIAVIAGLLFSLTASAEDKQTREAMKKMEPLPRDLEIQLALSALPPHLRDNATVHVLNPEKGFEIVRKGTNGFHALVDRTDDAAFRGAWPITEYRDDLLVPISFDKAGIEAQMQVMFDVAEMQAKGTPPGELKSLIKDRYKTGYYKAPQRVGISYMLSPILRTYENPDESARVGTFNFPHIMYYAPNVSNEDIGGKPGPGSLYPQVITPGLHGYIIQPLGLTERTAINKEYEEMLGRLCKIKEAWCLPKEKGQY